MIYNYVEAVRAPSIQYPNWNHATRSLLTIYLTRRVDRSVSQCSTTEFLSSDWRRAAEFYRQNRSSAFTDDAVLRVDENSRN